MIKAKAPSHRMLKHGFIKRFNKWPNKEMMLVCISNSVATKKGNREGTTELAHRAKLDLIAGRLLFEKMSKQKVNPKNNKGNKFLFSFIT